MLPERLNRYLDRPGPGAAAPAVYVPPVQDTPVGDSIPLRDFTAPLWRRKSVIAAAAVAGLLGGLAVSALMPPTYRARTSLQVEGFNDDHFLRKVSPISPALPNATAENYLQNEVKLLESEALASRVADKLGIGTETRRGTGGWLTPVVRLRNHLAFLRPWPVTPEQRRIEAVRKQLKVRTSLQSQVIELFFDAPDPSGAARGANTAAAEFVALNREARWQLAEDTTEWLNRQALDLKRTLERSNRQLQDFARSSGLVFAGNQGTLAQDRMRQVQDALTRAQADRAAKQARYEAAVANPSTLMSDALATGPLRQYETDLQNLRRQLAELQTIFTATNSKVQRIQAQIAQTENAIKAECNAIIGRLRTEFQAATALERMLQAEQDRQLKTVEGQMDRERQYNVLKSEVDTTQRLYDSMLQQAKEAGVASALNTTNIRIIDRATAPAIPYSPKPPLNMAIGFALGSLAGVGLVLLGERSDRVKQPGQAVLLNVPELGVIPSAKPARRLALPRPSLLGPRPASGDLGLVTWEQDESLVSESFRAALASILFSPGVNHRAGRFRGPALVVTSIDAMEGKSTVVANLGIVLAETKRRVLLIDADLRSPRLHEVFDVCNDWGLTDLLKGGEPEPADDARPDMLARPTRVPDLWLLPSGPGDAAISSLLYSARLGSLLRRFRQDFDLVLVDTPPLGLFPDARVLGRLSNGVVMVVRANTKSKQDLASACARLMQDRIPIIGTILNDWKMDPGQSRSYGRYYRRQQRRSA